MRSITLNGTNHVELWPGGRLFVPNDDLLVKLPTGCITLSGGKVRKIVSLGSATATSVQIHAPATFATDLFNALLEQQRPTDTRTVKTIRAR